MIEKRSQFIRKEIKRAISKKRNIVPLFFDDFRFKDYEDLLYRIKFQRLKKCNGIDIKPSVFSECIKRLNKNYLVNHLDVVEEHKKPTEEIFRFVRDAAQILPSQPETVFTIPSPNKTSYISGTTDFWRLNEEEEKQVNKELQRLNIPGLYYGDEQNQ